MNYYLKNGDLYTSNLPVDDVGFVKITEEEYLLRLSEIQVEQEQAEEDEWFINTASEGDYIEALKSLGVVF